MNQTHNHLPEKKVSVPAPTCFQRQKYLKITQNGQKFSVIAPLSRKNFFFFCPRPPHPLHPHHAVISSYTEVNSHAFSPSYRVFRPKNHDFVSHVADRSYVGLYISFVFVDERFVHVQRFEGWLGLCSRTDFLLLWKTWLFCVLNWSLLMLRYFIKFHFLII